MRGSLLFVVLVAVCLASCIAKPSRVKPILSKIRDVSRKRAENSGDVKREEEAEAKEENKVVDPAAQLVTLYRFELQLLMGHCAINKELDRYYGELPEDHPLVIACKQFTPGYMEYENLNSEQKKAADNELMKTGQYDLFDLICRKLAISAIELDDFWLTPANSAAAKHLPRYRELCKSWSANSDETDAENKTNEDKTNTDAEGGKKRENKTNEDNANKDEEGGKKRRTMAKLQGHGSVLPWGW